MQKYDRKILFWNILHSIDYYSFRDHEILWVKKHLLHINLNFNLSNPSRNLFTDLSLSSVHVMSHFKDAINSLTDINDVMLKYETVMYAQKVLVSELLKMLIQKNIEVDVKRAHQILKKSNKIRKLFNLEWIRNM